MLQVNENYNIFFIKQIKAGPGASNVELEQLGYGVPLIPKQFTVREQFNKKTTTTKNTSDVHVRRWGTEKGKARQQRLW